MEMKLNDNIILGRQTKDIYKTNLSTVNFKNAGEISRQVISILMLKLQMKQLLQQHYQEVISKNL